MDLERREVTMDGVPVRLTPLEYRLLEALAQRAGKVATHAQLLNEVWGPVGAGQTHYLRIYMGTLRRKIEPDATRPRLPAHRAQHRLPAERGLEGLHRPDVHAGVQGVHDDPAGRSSR